VRKWKSFIAGVLCALIPAESVQAYSFGPSAAPSAFHIVLPRSLGYVADASATHTAAAPDVILIQDLHVNRSVQFAISGILKRLKTQGLMPDHIAVEGATGPVDIAAMQRYPDPVIRKEASDYLVRQGEMPGAMHFAVTEGEGGLFGIETDEYYQANLEMFRRSYADRTRLREELAKIQAVLPKLEKDATVRDNARILEEDLQAVNKLINNQAIPQELPAILNRANAAVEHLKLVLPGSSNLIQPLTASVNFYALALLRDEELFKNTLAVRELGRQKTTIMVTGGFHTAGLVEQCNRRGLSYVVITPNVRRNDQVDQKLYIERLLDHHLTPEQVEQGLDWAAMDKIQVVYRPSALFWSAVKQAIPMRRSFGKVALLSSGALAFTVLFPSLTHAASTAPGQVPGWWIPKAAYTLLGMGIALFLSAGWLMLKSRINHQELPPSLRRRDWLLWGSMAFISASLGLAYSRVHSLLPPPNVEIKQEAQKALEAQKADEMERSLLKRILPEVTEVDKRLVEVIGAIELTSPSGENDLSGKTFPPDHRPLPIGDFYEIGIVSQNTKHEIRRFEIYFEEAHKTIAIIRGDNKKTRWHLSRQMPSSTSLEQTILANTVTLKGSDDPKGSLRLKIPSFIFNSGASTPPDIRVVTGIPSADIVRSYKYVTPKKGTAPRDFNRDEILRAAKKWAISSASLMGLIVGGFTLFAPGASAAEGPFRKMLENPWQRSVLILVAGALLASIIKLVILLWPLPHNRNAAGRPSNTSKEDDLAPGNAGSPGQPKLVSIENYQQPTIEEIEEALRFIGKQLREQAPSQHSLRTPQCPSLPHLATGKLTSAELEHVKTCAYCQKILSMAQNTELEPAAGQNKPLSASAEKTFNSDETIDTVNKFIDGVDPKSGDLPAIFIRGLSQKGMDDWINLLPLHTSYTSFFRDKATNSNGASIVRVKWDDKTGSSDKRLIEEFFRKSMRRRSFRVTQDHGHLDITVLPQNKPGWSWFRTGAPGILITLVGVLSHLLLPGASAANVPVTGITSIFHYWPVLAVLAAILYAIFGPPVFGPGKRIRTYDEADHAFTMLLDAQGMAAAGEAVGDAEAIEFVKQNIAQDKNSRGMRLARLRPHGSLLVGVLAADKTYLTRVSWNGEEVRVIRNEKGKLSDVILYASPFGKIRIGLIDQETETPRIRITKLGSGTSSATPVPAAGQRDASKMDLNALREDVLAKWAKGKSKEAYSTLKAIEHLGVDAFVRVAERIEPSQLNTLHTGDLVFTVASDENHRIVELGEISTPIEHDFANPHIWDVGIGAERAPVDLSDYTVYRLAKHDEFEKFKTSAGKRGPLDGITSVLIALTGFGLYHLFLSGASAAIVPRSQSISPDWILPVGAILLGLAAYFGLRYLKNRRTAGPPAGQPEAQRITWQEADLVYLSARDKEQFEFVDFEGGPPRSEEDFNKLMSQIWQPESRDIENKFERLPDKRFPDGRIRVTHLSAADQRFRFDDFTSIIAAGVLSHLSGASVLLAAGVLGVAAFIALRAYYDPRRVLMRQYRKGGLDFLPSDVEGVVERFGPEPLVFIGKKLGWSEDAFLVFMSLRSVQDEVSSKDVYYEEVLLRALDKEWEFRKANDREHAKDARSFNLARDAVKDADFFKSPATSQPGFSIEQVRSVTQALQAYITKSRSEGRELTQKDIFNKADRLGTEVRIELGKIFESRLLVGLWEEGTAKQRIQSAILELASKYTDHDLRDAVQELLFLALTGQDNPADEGGLLTVAKSVIIALGSGWLLYRLFVPLSAFAANGSGTHGPDPLTWKAIIGSVIAIIIGGYMIADTYISATPYSLKLKWLPYEDKTIRNTLYAVGGILFCVGLGVLAGQLLIPITIIIAAALTLWGSSKISRSPVRVLPRIAGQLVVQKVLRWKDLRTTFDGYVDAKRPAKEIMNHFIFDGFGNGAPALPAELDQFILSAESSPIGYIGYRLELLTNGQIRIVRPEILPTAEKPTDRPVIRVVMGNEAVYVSPQSVHSILQQLPDVNYLVVINGERIDNYEREIKPNETALFVPTPELRIEPNGIGSSAVSPNSREALEGKPIEELMQMVDQVLKGPRAIATLYSPEINRLIVRGAQFADFRHRHRPEYKSFRGDVIHTLLALNRRPGPFGAKDLTLDQFTDDVTKDIGRNIEDKDTQSKYIFEGPWDRKFRTIGDVYVVASGAKEHSNVYKDVAFKKLPSGRILVTKAGESGPVVDSALTAALEKNSLVRTLAEALEIPSLKMAHIFADAGISSSDLRNGNLLARKMLATVIDYLSPVIPHSEVSPKFDASSNRDPTDEIKLFLGTPESTPWKVVQMSKERNHTWYARIIAYDAKPIDTPSGLRYLKGALGQRYPKSWLSYLGSSQNFEEDVIAASAPEVPPAGMRAGTNAFDIFLSQKPIYDEAMRDHRVYDAAANAAEDFNGSLKESLKESYRENGFVQHCRDKAMKEFERANAAYQRIKNAKLEQAPIDEWDAGDFNDMVAFFVLGIINGTLPRTLKDLFEHPKYIELRTLWIVNHLLKTDGKVIVGVNLIPFEAKHIASFFNAYSWIIPPMWEAAVVFSADLDRRGIVERAVRNAAIQDENLINTLRNVNVPAHSKWNAKAGDVAAFRGPSPGDESNIRRPGAAKSARRNTNEPPIKMDPRKIETNINITRMFLEAGKVRASIKRSISRTKPALLFAALLAGGLAFFGAGSDATGSLASVLGFGYLTDLILSLVGTVFHFVSSQTDTYHALQATYTQLHALLSHIDLKSAASAMNHTPGAIFTLAVGFVFDLELKNRLVKQLALLKSKTAAAIAA
jgi:hypothetical protein